MSTTRVRKVRVRSIAKLRVAALGAARTSADATEIDAMTLPRQVACDVAIANGVRQGQSSKSGTIAPVRRYRHRKIMGADDDNSEMGADLLSGVCCRRHTRLHRHIGGIRGHRALPVLRVRGDLPGAADPGIDDLQGVGAHSRLAVIARSSCDEAIQSLPVALD